ncbi:MAG: FUSC family protein, partial [Gloeobacteraceae cyanobacterium ES-bin-316]|nr:FUSC family protein [Ferruginibacter sp.]
ISLELADLYESVMTTYQQYSFMHEHFDKTGILQSYQKIIYQLSAEMEEISLAIKSGFSSAPKNDTRELVVNNRKLFERLRQDYMKDENVENFVSLGRIQGNLEAIAEKVNQMHLFTSYEVTFKNEKKVSPVFGGVLATQDLRPSLLISNLHFGSNIFRHSIRVALALLVGYIVSLLFKADHGYWILLTIIVILKPAYSLSKRRNSDRLIGTVAGIAVGVLILFFFKNQAVLWVILVILMGGSYMFLRTNYFLSVLLMTTYLLIFFQYAYPGNIGEIAQERLIDTVIGSAIAFFASFFIIPAWEKNGIRAYMIQMLEANKAYFTSIASYFVTLQPVDEAQLKSARRELLITLANLSDAFTRMLSEPKKYQQDVQHIHRFVSINHAIIAHLASLSYLLQKEKNSFRSADLQQVIEAVEIYFDNAINILSAQADLTKQANNDGLKKLNEQMQVLLQARKIEIAAGNLETNTKAALVESKSVIDQFNFIHSNAAVLCKIVKEHEAGVVNKRE